MVIKTKVVERIRGPGTMAKILQDILKAEREIDRDKEHFWTIGLGTSNIVEYIDLTTLGTIDSSVIHPRETYRFAILKGVAKIITAHNHPSGDLRPSLRDLQVVKRLLQAGEVVGIRMIDHLIITEEGFRSIMGKFLKYTNRLNL